MTNLMTKHSDVNKIQTLSELHKFMQSVDLSEFQNYLEENSETDNSGTFSHVYFVGSDLQFVIAYRIVMIENYEYQRIVSDNRLWELFDCAPEIHFVGSTETKHGDGLDVFISPRYSQTIRTEIICREFNDLVFSETSSKLVSHSTFVDPMTEELSDDLENFLPDNSDFAKLFRYLVDLLSPMNLFVCLDYKAGNILETVGSQLIANDCFMISDYD